MVILHLKIAIFQFSFVHILFKIPVTSFVICYFYPFSYVMTSFNLEENANFTRLNRLLVDKGTEALRINLDGIHPPAALPAVLNANKGKLLKLKPRVINDSQWDLLFPPSGNPPDSRKFDVSLLTILFRNICMLPAPATRWDKMPPDNG